MLKHSSYWKTKFLQPGWISMVHWWWNLKDHHACRIWRKLHFLYKTFLTLMYLLHVDMKIFWTYTKGIDSKTNSALVTNISTSYSYKHSIIWKNKLLCDWLESLHFYCSKMIECVVTHCNSIDNSNVLCVQIRITWK